MTKTVNVHEAKTHLSRLLEEVARGDDVVIARAGEPVAKLVSVHGPQERRLGFVEGSITDAFFDALPDKELSAWE